MLLCPCYKGKHLSCLPVCFSGYHSPFKIGSALEGKNLLQQEQILTYKELLYWDYN